MVGPALSQRAESLAERLGLSYDQPPELAFTVNVLIDASIVGYTLMEIGHT